ncbi:DNA polymerase III subunit delta [Sphingomonas nostoxanthinifaciens]|uniref:DNA polymerase III subunit delta n=1 Tax=Sphingomonas nostoxanthinifaciens TaxID=2872652 RepID=UPI001CC1D02B|nr:DNA polymerase III subunit delta [Sphingomonas nostoxanthinifaciens]UAK24328.1 DNA polymerase III subunit delta [Sphingomonas nostoxanthinifaciens]
MKPAEAALLRALDGADPAIRLYLLHGPDEAGSRALAARLGKALGADAERIDLTSAMLKADPARLADEAAAIGLFGGRRWIRLDPAADDACDAIAALLEAPAAGNPVAAIGGTLRKDARLLKLVQASGAALAHASYLPEGRDADALVTEMARALGLQARPDVARRLASATGGDRAIIGQELEKLALYLDAAPERPHPLEHDALDALGAATEEGDLSRLTRAVFSGEPQAVDEELARLASEGVEGITVLRALSRRALQLAQLRAQMAAGDSVEHVMQTAGRAIFWKEQAQIRAELMRWTPEGLATAIGRLAEAERQVKSPGYPGHALVEQELLAISRFAARRR